MIQKCNFEAFTTYGPPSFLSLLVPNQVTLQEMSLKELVALERKDVYLLMREDDDNEVSKPFAVSADAKGEIGVAEESAPVALAFHDQELAKSIATTFWLPG